MIVPAALTLWNCPLEVAVIQRMILDINRQPLVMRIEGRALGHGPRLEDTVQLKPQIIM
jgi:hypothetical protein